MHEEKLDRTGRSWHGISFNPGEDNAEAEEAEHCARSMESGGSLLGFLAWSHYSFAGGLEKAAVLFQSRLCHNLQNDNNTFLIWLLGGFKEKMKRNIRTIKMMQNCRSILLVFRTLTIYKYRYYQLPIMNF